MHHSSISVLGSLVLLATAAPGFAQTAPTPAGSPNLAPPTAEQVRGACRSNQATALPNPFLDVSPDHWAFAAVMNLYYCGPGRRGIAPRPGQPTSAT